MLGLAFVLFFQVGLAPTPSVNITPTEPPVTKTRTVCTNERATGSRLQAKKVCREIGPGAKDTAAQIQMREDLRNTQNSLPVPTGNGIPGQ